MKRAFLALILLASCAPAREAVHLPARRAPLRIVSLDYCADQFVLRLADRDQIAALSPDAVREFSYLRASAQGVPRVRATAEAVLALRPDLVVRAYGGGADAARFFARAGIPVAQIEFAEDFTAVRHNIRTLSAAFHRPARGESLIAEMDARLAAVNAANTANARRPSVLYMTPGGVTAGAGTFINEMMRAAGLRNFSEEPGWRPLPLERLAYTQPDRVAAAFFSREQRAYEGWSAARHPLARRLLHDRPVALLDGAATSCGAWFALDAVEALQGARR